MRGNFPSSKRRRDVESSCSPCGYRGDVSLSPNTTCAVCGGVGKSFVNSLPMRTSFPSIMLRVRIYHILDPKITIWMNWMIIYDDVMDVIHSAKVSSCMINSKKIENVHKKPHLHAVSHFMSSC